MIEILIKGGLISWILAIMSAVTAALIVFKAMQFLRINISDTRFINKALKDIYAGNINSTAARLQKSNNPTARTMSYILNDTDNYSDETKENIRLVGEVELAKLRNYLPWLETIAQIAPMIGLLGTVVGMIKSFKDLATAGAQIDIAMLSGGIWVALVTTALGLIVAVMALMAVSYFDSKISKAQETMSIAVSKLVSILTKQ